MGLGKKGGKAGKKLERRGWMLVGIGKEGKSLRMKGEGGKGGTSEGERWWEWEVMLAEETGGRDRVS